VVAIRRNECSQSPEWAVTVATTLKSSAGGQFAVHVQALPGRPYDGHTPAQVIPAVKAVIGCDIKRIIADAGYRGHNAPAPCDQRVNTAGQKRGVTTAIRRIMRCRSAVEPVIGHLKNDHRNHLVGQAGDAANAVLAAVAYSFRRLPNWLALFCALLHHTLGANAKAAKQSERIIPNSNERDSGIHMRQRL
jgi:transposase, IS5 family